MKYTNIIDDMTWSYSRIGSFNQCPYQFLMHYIYGEHEKPMFFSDYGSFMHELIAEHLESGTPSDDLVIKFLKDFRKSVKGEAPNEKIFEKYFDRGAEYLSQIDTDLERWKPLAIEERYNFSLGGRKFVGIVDMVCETDDGDLVILDHKSHQLKPRSGRKKPTKGDAELDEYLRQLYLYCIPVKQKFGRFPKWLVFNCFRNDDKTRFIIEPFDEERFEEAKRWALDSIERIRQEEEWSADAEYWKCHHICGLSDQCEFFSEE